MTEKVYAIMENRGRHPTRATRSRTSDPTTGPGDPELDRPTPGDHIGSPGSRTYGLFIDAPHWRPDFPNPRPGPTASRIG